MGGLSVSQLLLGLGDTSDYQLFILASVLVSLAVVPVSLSVGTAPRIDAVPDPLKLRELWSIAPLGLVGAFLVGATNGGFTSIAPIYAAEAGLDTGEVGVFMTIALLGAVVLQFPIGYASDRMYRRRAIALVAVVLATLSIVATLVDGTSPAMLVLIFFVGGLLFPMYSLIASHVSDVVPPERALAAATATVFYSGVGAVAGPLVLSFAIQFSGVTSFFWMLSVMNAAIALFALLMIVLRGPSANRSAATLAGAYSSFGSAGRHPSPSPRSSLSPYGFEVATTAARLVFGRAVGRFT